MRVHILFDREATARWHLWLLDALAERGLRHVTVTLGDHPASALPPGLGLLLDLERLTGRARGESAIDAVSPDDPQLARVSQNGASAGTDADPMADLTIDLRAMPRLAATRPVLVPLYDGEPGMAALWLALLDRRAPFISLATGSDVPAVSAAHPAIEDPHNLGRAVTHVLARAVEAIACATADIAAGRSLLSRATMAAPHAQPGTPGTAMRFTRALLENKARSILAKRLGTAPRWSVAHRSAEAGRTHPPASLEIERFSLLHDDGQRYFADPFLFAHGGVLHLFVEEFPYVTGRGIISHAVIGPDGQFSTPRPVLERPYHLSYPQVFQRDGEIWMLPETAASGAIELYRAERFPDRWVLAARLIEGRLHDATLFDHGGRLWITAGSECRGSATWDGLSVFHAEHLHGPWTPHPRNPVLVDARAARPAGDVYHVAGELWRPAQDCTRGYGSALSQARVTRLDPEGFAQEIAATVRAEGRPDPLRRRQSVLGPHTINWAAGIEVIDLYAPSAWRPGA